jgi:hypothetical protein
MQTGSGAHPSFSLMGKKVLFTGERSGWDVKPTNHVNLVPMIGISGAKPPI